MNSCAPIPAPLPLALERFGAWIGLPGLDPPPRCRSRDSVDFACVGSERRGVALFAHEAIGWTVCDDYHLDDWVDAPWFVDSDDLAGGGASDGTLLPYRADGPAGDFMAARSEEE